MNKNKTPIIIVSLIILAGLGYFLFSQNSQNSADSEVEEPVSEITDQNQQTDNNTETEVTEEVSNPLREKLLTNVTLTIPEVGETISMGSELEYWGDNENRIDPYGYVYIGEEVAEITPEGYIVGTVEVNSGGNANLVYLAVFEPGEASWQMTDAILLENEARVESIRTDSNTIYVDYLTYGSDQAHAEKPNTENSEIYVYNLDKTLELLPQ